MNKGVFYLGVLIMVVLFGVVVMTFSSEELKQTIVINEVVRAGVPIANERDVPNDFEELTASGIHGVTITDDSFEPMNLIINVGDTVIWTNRGNGEQQVRNIGNPGLFSSETISPGETWSFTFEQEHVGSVSYSSPFHEGFIGEIIIQ